MKFSAFIAAILLTVGFIACGGDSEEAQPMDTGTTEMAPETAPAPQADSAAMPGDSAMGDTAAK